MLFDAAPRVANESHHRIACVRCSFQNKHKNPEQQKNQKGNTTNQDHEKKGHGEEKVNKGGLNAMARKGPRL